ncbi:telomere repeats-binding bouquet formation protein 1 isoform X2 [Hemicordylus capensis]|uniref:telomere repeats-binding bouquet formation protein 1 isoform X2 n=1 Tax=Hemicordylus capensis TaxID=884348 RepID=UPI0023038EAA|nr:telomere repeats-binding bouquet formation protein 1 isoform X2 [Hemicordylus capensis]
MPSEMSLAPAARRSLHKMKTDLNLLLECLKYQMDHPVSQKEALVTIYSVCQQNRDASDYFREIGGLMFVHHLAKSSVQSIVKEAALFTLGGLAENNVFCQQMLCTSGLFEDLHMFLINKDSSVNLKRMSVYVILVLVSNNKSGQTFVRESGCLDVLLQLFRTTLSVSEVNLLDQNINQYHLWSSVCSALSACVNNPQNEDNQKTCSLVFPLAKDWLQTCMKPEIVRPICSLIGLTVANNSQIQKDFFALGGLAVLDELLVKLIDPMGNYSATKLAVVVTKTLDACISDNSEVGVGLSRYNTVANLLMLLSYNILDSGEKFSIILTLGHCTDGCEINQYTLVKNNGLPLMIQALTESQDEELNKAAIFVLQNCKQLTEKLSQKLSEHSLNMDDTGQLEADLQIRERIFDNYRDKAKNILHRIEQLENQHQKDIFCSNIQTVESKHSNQKHYRLKNILHCLQRVGEKQKRNTPEMLCNRSCETSKNGGHKLHQDDKIGKPFFNVTPEQNHNISRHLNKKVRRQIFIDDDDITQEEIIQTASKHVKGNASVQNSNKVMAYTKMNHPFLNSISDELIAAKFAHGSSKNVQLKSVNRNSIASVSQSEHNHLHAADKMKTANINKVHVTSGSISKSGTSGVRASEFLFKQPDFVVGSIPQRVQSKEPLKLCSSMTNRKISCILTPMDPKMPELRCSGCITGLFLNSRNFNQILQSCKYLCEQHKVILETEMKYKRKLKRHVISGKVSSADYNGNMNRNNTLEERFRIQPTRTKPDLQANQDTKEQSNQKNYFKDKNLNKKLTYSFDEDENTESHLSDISEIASKRSKRRIRKDFTSEEISYLLEGVNKMGHHWNSILWAYPFQKGRTNIDLAKKYSKLQKNEKNKDI